MKHLRLVITFYRSFIIASSLISLLCVGALILYGLKTFSTVFILKLFSLGVIVLYINLYKKKAF
jgi:hypothetical protein